MPPYRIEWLDEAKADVRAVDCIEASLRLAGVNPKNETAS
jgi:hypothetical protein